MPFVDANQRSILGYDIELITLAVEGEGEDFPQPDDPTLFEGLQKNWAYAFELRPLELNLTLGDAQVVDLLKWCRENAVLKNPRELLSQELDELACRVYPGFTERLVTVFFRKDGEVVASIFRQSCDADRLDL